jgi:hypothetical protein
LGVTDITGAAGAGGRVAGGADATGGGATGLVSIEGFDSTEDLVSTGGFASR